jgi:transposase
VPWTKAYWKWLHGLKLEQPGDQLVLEDCLLELAHCEQRLVRLRAQLEELAKTEQFAVKVSALKCFKGIDTATAMGIVTELVSPARFKSARHVMSYAGLSICEDSSGERTRRTTITKSGNHHLRRLLIRAAGHASKAVTKESKGMKARRAEAPSWAAELGRRAERRLHEKSRHLSAAGKHANVVTTAVARELAGWIWASLMHDVVTGAAPAIAVDTDGVPLA